jgi:hypothetical protein
MLPPAMPAATPTADFTVQGLETLRNLEIPFQPSVTQIL